MTQPNQNEDLYKPVSLVTGATGFVGSVLAQKLVEKGQRVRALVRSSSDTKYLHSLGVETVTGDLTDLDSLERAVANVSNIYHLGEVAMSVPQAADLNIRAVAKMAELAGLQSGFKRFVFLSSLTVRSVPVTLPADETTAIDPGQAVADYYTEYKRGCERALVESGVPTSIVRAGTIYGEGAEYLKKFIHLCNRVPFAFPVPGRLDAFLATIHVLDLAAVMQASSRYRENEFREFHAVDDSQGSIGDFLDWIAASADRKIRFWAPPIWLQRLGAGLLDPLLALKLPGRNATGILLYVGFDQQFTNKRIKGELGVRFQHPVWDDVDMTWLRQRQPKETGNVI